MSDKDQMEEDLAFLDELKDLFDNPEIDEYRVFPSTFPERRPGEDTQDWWVRGKAEQEHQKLTELMSTFPERRPDEDTQDWLARAMAERLKSMENKHGVLSPITVAIKTECFGGYKTF